MERLEQQATAQDFTCSHFLRGPYDVFVQFTGMKTLKQHVVVYGEGKLNFNLKEEIIALKEVLIQSDADLNVSNMQMGSVTLDMKQLKNVPKVLGENDILKVALALPGVKSIGEGSAGLNVRGGKKLRSKSHIAE